MSGTCGRATLFEILQFRKVLWPLLKCHVTYCPRKTIFQNRIYGPKPKAYDGNKVLVEVKCVSIFNPIYFYQHLTMHYPHQSPNQLRHPEEESMSPSIKFFSQAIALAPDDSVTVEKITGRFAQKG